MKHWALILTTIAPLCVVGCGGDGGDASKPRAAKSSKSKGKATTSAMRKERNPRIFNRSLGEPEYLDPGLITESEGGTVTHDTFEGLYQYGPTHKEWLPGVAESHEVSLDGKTWTFKLRKTAKWSDGKPVTAHDFEWSWKRVLDPTTGSRYSGIMWVLDGAKAYNQNSDKTKSVELREKVGAKALDDYTFQVRLLAPTPYFLQLTAFYTFAPVPRHVVEKFGDKWARPENMVSNGPWTVTEWVSHQRIVAEKNPHYWDSEVATFDRINFLITQENTPAHNMYESNEIDFLENKLPPPVLPRYRRERFPDMQTSPYLGVYFYMFNVKRKPFDDVRVRQALNLAVNKAKIGKFVVKGGQEAATSIVHPGLEDTGYTLARGAQHDPDEARRLLAEAGFPGGKGFPYFKISYNTLETHKQLAEYVQQQWKRELGITCDLDNMEWKVLLKKQHAREFDMSRLAWIGDFLDPLTFLDLWEGDNPNNRTNWNHTGYNDLVAAARLEADPQKRLGLLNRAEQIYVEELPSMPLYYYVNHDLVKPWVKGYKAHLQGVHSTRFFRVEL